MESTIAITEQTFSPDVQMEIYHTINIPAHIAIYSIDILVCLVVMVGNAVIITAFARTKKLRDQSTPIIISLALADFFVGLLHMINRMFLLRYLEYWTIKNPNLIDKLYRTFLFFETWAVFSSKFHLLAIGIDRCISIMVPLRYESLVTPRITKVMLGVVWITAILLSIPEKILEGTTAKYTLVVRIIVYFCISSSIATIYGKIGMVALQQRRCIMAIEREQPDSQMTHEEKVPKVTKTLGAVLGFYVLLYFPAFVILFWLAINDYMGVIPSPAVFLGLWYATLASPILSTMNSGANVFIYSFMNTKYRTLFFNLLKCQSTPDLDLESTKPDQTSHTDRSKP